MEMTQEQCAMELCDIVKSCDTTLQACSTPHKLVADWVEHKGEIVVSVYSEGVIKHFTIPDDTEKRELCFYVAKKWIIEQAKDAVFASLRSTHAKIEEITNKIIANNTELIKQLEK